MESRTLDRHAFPTEAGETDRPAARPKGEFHIPSLDGIRAISFLIVFVAHAGLANIIPGGFGVTIFFFLSGYLITTLLRLEQAGTGRVSLRDFYLRRALRILPPFYAVLALAVLLSLTHLLTGELRASPLIALVLHVTNYWSIFYGTAGLPPGSAVYWSLAVEEHFYLLFPFAFILLSRLLPGRRGAQALVLLGFCALVLAWRVVLVAGLHSPSDRTYLGSDTRIDSILFGCVLAVGKNPILDPYGASTGAWRKVFLPLACGLFLFTFLYRAPWFRETLRYTLHGIALAPLFVVAIREPSLLPFRFLNLKAVRHVGALSYSLYLVHYVVIYLLEAQLPGLHVLPRGLLAFGLSLAMAEAIHRLIEKPCARLRRRLAHATWMGAAAAPPAAARGQ